jgi:vesicle transport through interaction with t-SNAREs protein 1
MTELFDTYAAEYEKLSGDVNTQVAEVANLKGERRKAKLKKIAKDMEELKAALKNLDAELLTSSQELKPKLRMRVSNYRSDFMAIEREYQNATSTSINMDRDDLLGGRTTEEIAADERTRLLAGTQRLEQHSQSIARSKRIAAECEDVGQDIMQNLGRQREGIERSINMVRETNAEVTRAGKGITIMQRRAMTNKLILALIIISLVAAILLIVWFKYLRPLFQ